MLTTIAASINWGLVIKAIWTLVIIPILVVLKGKIDKWAEANNMEKYTNMLYSSANSVVKQLQDDIVKEIKGTDEWTEEKIEEIAQLAIDKTIEGLSNEAYKYLLEANSDFYNYVDTVIKAQLYDLKQEEKKNA